MGIDCRPRRYAEARLSHPPTGHKGWRGEGEAQLDLGEAVDDRLEVVGADLVEEAADLWLQTRAP